MGRTVWHPDTCGCELAFERGPEQPPTLVNKCEVHKDATGDDIWNENRNVNNAKRVLYERHGVDPHSVKWSFGPTTGKQRSLTVEVEAIHADIAEELTASPFGAVTVRKGH